MLYPHKLMVYRKTEVSDGIGGVTETYSLTAGLSDVSCNMRQLRAEEKIINDKMAIEATHRVHCSNISITVSDQIFITPYGTTVSDLYDVQTLNIKRELGSGTVHHLEIDIRVIK